MIKPLQMSPEGNLIAEFIQRYEQEMMAYAHDLLPRGPRKRATEVLMEAFTRPRRRKLKDGIQTPLRHYRLPGMSGV